MLFIFETIMFPSNAENTFFMLSSFPFFTMAAIAGPFPETDAPKAPFSSRFVIILGSEFNIVDVPAQFHDVFN